MQQLYVELQCFCYILYQQQSHHRQSFSAGLRMLNPSPFDLKNKENKGNLETQVCDYLQDIDEI